VICYRKNESFIIQSVQIAKLMSLYLQGWCPIQNPLIGRRGFSYWKKYGRVLQSLRRLVDLPG